MPTADLVSRRVPWRAALISLPLAGLGQLYCGRPLRALIVQLLSVSGSALFLVGFLIPLKRWNIVIPVAGALLWWVFVLADAAHCAKRAASDYRLKAYNRWYVYLLLIVLIGIGQETLNPFVRLQVLQAFKIPVASMTPTLVVGDRILVNKLVFAPRDGLLARFLSHQEPRWGDLVVFKFTLTDEQPEHSENFVERVIGQPGDHIRIVHRQVFVNGTALTEPYAFHDPAFSHEARPGDDFPPPDPGDLVAITSSWSAEIGGRVKDGELVVPPEKYFVLGDNREQSWDSRFWGFVSRADILGKADVIYFSWDTKGRRVRWERVGEILK